MSTLTMIHVPFDKLFTTLETLYQELYLDADVVELHPVFTRCDVIDNGIVKVPNGRNIRVQFKLRNGLKPQDKRIDFWNRLIEMGYEVIWKKDNKGYEMGKDGVVLDSWKLDDGGC